MSFKGLLFGLFLYVCLVWVGAAFWYSGQDMERFGLLWTAVGLIAILAFIIVSRIWGWTRTMRARAAAKPKPIAVKAPIPVSEDEAAMSALIDQANTALRQAPAYAQSTDASPVSQLPLYLLIGPEESGKTTTFCNSGLEPQLLAGDPVSASSFLPTRLCNLWLARNALFVELGGRLFTGDAVRWRQILRSFQVKATGPAWRRFWTEPEKGFDLRGVVAFCDVKEFAGTLTPQGRERLDRQARDWQDRLGAIAEVFQAGFPVYFVIAKSDELPYFADFFRRLSDTEADQVFGSTLPVSTAADPPASVQSESKRLTKSFSTLYHSVAERRIWHLSHEPDLTRRTAIYEFPRELKRIRPAVVHFLSSTFRIHPLRPNPRLRGFYFTGAGERLTEPNLAESATHNTEGSAALEATMLFRSDATQILRAGEPAISLKVAPRRGVTQRWLFVRELFQELVLRDQPSRAPAPLGRQMERRRMVACAAVCGFCLLLCAIFLSSWMRNRQLLATISSSAGTEKHGTTPTLAELQSLDNLRSAVSQLVQYEHEGAPVGLRWGLYTGDRVAEAARGLYFRRFQDLLLNPLNGVMTAHLESLSTSPGPNDAYYPVFRLLETHLMISSGACTPDPVLVAGTLKGALPGITPAGDTSSWQSLANRQIDFYSSELKYGNPCRLAENTVARDRARQYLAQIRGVDRIYANILAEGEKSFSKTQRLADLSPDYATVLSGQSEVNGIFARDGWSYVENASKKSNSGAPGEACVLGEGRRFGIDTHQDAEVSRTIQRLFIRDYVERWRHFVTAFSVRGYAGPGDAGRKLEILSDHKSPLLAVLAMASNQTYFPQTTPEPEGLEKGKAVVKRLFPSLGNKSAKVPPTVLGARTAEPEPLSTTADVNRFFQPVHSVVAPGSDTWVNDKNGAYIDALAQLSHSMRDIERSGANPDQSIYQAAAQNHDKAMDAARQIASRFEPMGVGGLDVAVERLLEAPIRQTERFIVTDRDGQVAAKVNGQLRAVCARVRETLRKYPFSPSSEDATLEEVGSLFAPANGIVWKFEGECLGDFVVKDAGVWRSKDPSKKPQITQEMLTFLNRAQSIADAFYPAGATQPHVSYTLRPKLDPSYKDAVLELEMDGQPYAWTQSLQKQFTWPSSAPGKATGVVGRIRVAGVSVPFSSQPGIWAIFRVMADAEPRPLGGKLVEWKYLRSRDGRSEELHPPARLEIVDFPGGIDLFNPKFFEGLRCPSKAVQ